MLEPMAFGPVLLAPVTLAAGGSVAYLLRLTAAAASARPDMVTGQPRERIAVIIPAHDEVLVIGATLESLRHQSYPADRFEIVVIADNCTDHTAQIATEAGVTVLERFDPNLKGKGYALEWAISRLLHQDSASADPIAAFVIVDADTQAAPDFLARIIGRLFDGAPADRSRHLRALQGRYGVLNVDDSWRAALMTAALELVNHLRPLGKDHLGLSVGLKGNGMAFTRAVIEAVPWQGTSITEDIDYGLDLLREHGIPTGYAPDAIVRAQMPATAKQSRSQRERWEQGRYRLMRERVPELLRESVRRRDGRLLDAALDLLVPPLAELVVLHLVWAVLTGAFLWGGLLPGLAGVWLALPLLSLLGLAVYVLLGMKIAGAPPAAFAALWRVPLYIPWKLAVVIGGVLGRRRQADGKEPEWIRTERAPVHVEGKRP
jgi:glycosyltransferase involved in cell wall biosynthesis